MQFEFRQDLRHYASSSFYATFLSRVKMNSTNWPAPNVWVFIAQLVSTTALSQRGSNPVIVNFQLLKLPLPLRRSYLYLNLYFRSSHHLLSKICVITVCSDRGHLRSLYSTAISCVGRFYHLLLVCPIRNHVTCIYPISHLPPPPASSAFKDGGCR